LLVAVAGYSPAPREVERVTVIDVERRPHVRADAWLAPAEIEALATALGARSGETDAMYATEWSLAWTTGADACVWNRRGRQAWIDGGRFHIEGDALDVIAVEAYVERDMVERGVSVVLASGQRRVLARQHEPMAAIDPSYDGLDLLADATWARSLAKAIADALGVPLTLCSAL
jgi:hypothetical protein